MGRFIDLTGQRFGRLTVIGLAPTRTGVKTQWLCRCDCGKTNMPQAATLRNGAATSCGCLRAERVRAAHMTHGLHKAPEYMVWYQMHQRCSNHTHAHYRRYGGRGIAVCKEWQSLEAFIKSMGSRPSLAHELDRIDNDGNYEPNNCRWATRQQQAGNTSQSIRIEYRGDMVCLSEAARRAGAKYQTVLSRYHRGIRTEDAGLFA